MRKKNIDQKLYSLFTGELFAAIMFAVLWVLYLQMFDWAAAYLASLSSIYAFVVLEFILLQGSCYWFLKWRQVRRKNDPAYHVRLSYMSLSEIKEFIRQKGFRSSRLAKELKKQ